MLPAKSLRCLVGFLGTCAASLALPAASAEEVRVTVVATGLGRPATAVRAPLAQPRERELAASRDTRELRAEPPMRMVRRPMSSSDYAALDKPTVQRQRAVGDGLQPAADSEDLLDIPAFLRRQAD